MAKTKKLIVRQDEEKEIPSEVMADAIVEMSKTMKKLNSTRLTRAAVVTLIKDKTGLNKSTIEVVLNNLDDLEKNWLKKK